MQSAKFPLKRIIKLSAIILFLTSLFQVIMGVGKLLSQTRLFDFSIYYNYTKVYTHGGNPYLLIPSFNYPPSFLFLFSPFTLLNINYAQAVFTLISLISLLLSGYLLVRTYNKSLPVLLIILSCLLQNFPSKFTLAMGQINLVILLFLVLAFIYDQKNKKISAGIFYGLASMLKLTPLPLAIYFLIKRRYITLTVGLGIFAISNIILLVVFKNMHFYFVQHLPALITSINNSSSPYDQSIRVFLARIGLGEYSPGLSTIAVLILYLLAERGYTRLNKWMKEGKQSLKDLNFFALVLAITTIGNSFTWQHHLVFLFPGFIAETLSFLKSKRITRGILLIMGALLIGYHFPDVTHPPTANPFLLSYGTLGALLLIGMLLTNCL